MFLLPYEYQSEVNFVGVNSISGSIFLFYLLRVWYQSHICFTLDEGGNSISVQPKLIGGVVNSISISISGSTFVFYLLRVHSLSSSNPIYISPYMNRGSTPSLDPNLCSTFWESTPFDMCFYSLMLVHSIFCCELFFLNFFHMYARCM